MKVTAFYNWDSNFQRDNFELFVSETGEYPLKNDKTDDAHGIMFTAGKYDVINYKDISTEQYENVYEEDAWPNPQRIYFYTYQELWEIYEEEMNQSSDE